MNIKNMQNLFIFALLVLAFSSCGGKAVTVEKNENIHEYINSTKNLKQTADSLENAPSYEVYFTLDKTVRCISVSLETVTLPGKKTEESLPKKSFFVVEKILNMQNITAAGRSKYIQIGKNYNNNWEIHNPVKICGSTDDPVSRIGNAVFRVRFTTFDVTPVYFTIAVYTQANVVFSTNSSMTETTGSIAK